MAGDAFPVCSRQLYRHCVSQRDRLPGARNTRVAGFSAEAVAGDAARPDGGVPAASAQPVSDGEPTCTG